MFGRHACPREEGIQFRALRASVISGSTGRDPMLYSELCKSNAVHSECCGSSHDGVTDCAVSRLKQSFSVLQDVESDCSPIAIPHNRAQGPIEMESTGIARNASGNVTRKPPVYSRLAYSDSTSSDQRRRLWKP